MSIVGTRVLRKEDPTFLTAGARYLADLDDPVLAGALHVAFVRSPVAHARVISVDATDAASAPGVARVLTGADLADAVLVPAMVPLFPPAMMARPYLATDVVRFVGEPVAAVLAESQALAVDAAELVHVAYEDLPVVVDVEDAVRDEIVLFPEVGTNTCFSSQVFGIPEPSADFFAGCEVVVRERVVNQRVAICPLEGRAAAAAWDGERLSFWLSTQNVHAAKGALTTVFPDAEHIHVRAADVGGGFGAKISNYPEEIFTAVAAKLVGRPVRWVETRTENMVNMGHGRAQVQTVEIGGSRDGTVLAYRIHVLADAGAYPMLGAFLPFFTRTMASGTYAVPRIEATWRSVVTNTMGTVAYRGAGRPEAAAAIERAMDLFAAEIGMGAADVRRRNLVPADAFPYTTPTGALYDCGDYAAALDLALDAAGYADLRAEQARRREAGEVVQLGIGVASYVEITAGPGPQSSEWGKVEIRPDGSAVVYTGSSTHGQGHATSWSMLASEQLGIPFDQITVIHGDTELVPSGQGTHASRSLQIGGSAVWEAAGQVVDKARQLAADLLEASAADVVLDKERGVFHVAGTPARTASWAEVATAAGDGGLDADTDFTAAPTFPFGAHVAVVDVDTETGRVELRRIVTVDDAGRLLNPLLVEGQRHGGIAQGVAQALLEEVRYDEHGNPQTSNFADYGIISAAELPSFELVPMETPTPNNPLGAKGIGESGAIGSTPAVQSAVIDALSHLGIRHIDLPLGPQRVWEAISLAGDDATRQRA